MLSRGDPGVRWPYQIRYDVENKVRSDVVVLGAGISGCWAAIMAARKGAKVALVEKGCTIRSGCGGRGVDHWQSACTNPCSKVTPEEMTEAVIEEFGGHSNGITRYIACTESYETLLEIERMGGKIRDTEDVFKGADFRDEKTKLCFAYDYENRYTIRVWGAGIKAILVNELERLGVEVFDRTMVTSLIMDGAKVAGATGVNARTGEFTVFEAKAVVACMASIERLGTFATEQRGLASCITDPNNTGQGHEILFRAGAEFSLMEKTHPESGGFGYPMYGTGNSDNTWYPCTMVDSNGKEIPWVDRDGNVVRTIADRCKPAPGQKFFLMGGGLSNGHFMLGVPHPAWYKYKGPHLTPKLPEMIARGEIVPPLYADLPSMPEHERRAIFGLMVGNEGKTPVAIYKKYTSAGFDPDKDMLMSPNFPSPGHYMNPCSWAGVSPPHQRGMCFAMAGGVNVDWKLAAVGLEGLFAAGMNLLGSSEHSTAATTGRYAGRNAAEYALRAGQSPIDRKQVEAEKARVYAPLRNTSGYDWYDLNQGIARIMQDHCGEFKNSEGLELGLKWIEELRESEAKKAYAGSPHDLMRVLECLSLLTTGEMVLHASLGRKASSFHLLFWRTDYPEMDPPEWQRFTNIRRVNGSVKHSTMPMRYWEQAPYADNYEENYSKNCAK
jgi:succinate dehydrogenase/fumarate reductase flavoprotein subunit